MLLERPEHLADLDLHICRRLDAPEHDHPAILEQLGQLGADAFVLQHCAGDASHLGAERKTVVQCAHFD
jgi:hypothetical protein